MTILEFAQKVVALVGTGSEISFRELPEDDPKVRQPDITKARKLLGWEPKVALDDGLEVTLNYFKGRPEFKGQEAPAS
jgi:nucleoside-diphosphate-sugar epimerase